MVVCKNPTSFPISNYEPPECRTDPTNEHNEHHKKRIVYYSAALTTNKEQQTASTVTNTDL